MGKGGFAQKMLNFFTILKKNFWGDLGEFGAGVARTLESGDSRFRGNGKRGGMGERGGMGGIGLGGVFIWCFFWDVSFWSVGGVRMRVRRQKLNNSPFPRKRESPD